jgi:hypothetical protein
VKPLLTLAVLTTAVVGAAVLDSDDEIVEVATECITILKTKRDVLMRLRRYVA